MSDQPSPVRDVVPVVHVPPGHMGKEIELSGPAVRSATAGLPDDRRATSNPPKWALTPLKLWHCLWYRRWLALCLGLSLAAAGAAIGWFTEAPRYTAVALLRVQSSEHLLASADGARNSVDDEFRSTQVHLIKSRPVLQKVLKQDELRGLNLFRDKIDPAAWLEKELQSGFIKDTNILRLALSGDDPEELKVVVNAIKEQFFNDSGATERERQMLRVGELEKIYVAAEEKIRLQKETLRRLAETLKTADSQVLTLRQRLILEEFGAVRKELLTIDSELRRLGGQLKVQNASLKAVGIQEVSKSALNDALDQDPAVQKVAAEVSRLETTLHEYSKIVTSSSPRLAEYKESLKAAQAKLDKARLEHRPQVLEKLKLLETRRHELALVETQGRIKTLLEQREAVDKESTRLGQDADRIGSGSFELEMRRAELEQADGVLKQLRAEKERMNVEVQYNKQRVQKLQDADTPRLSQSSLTKMMAGYSIVGLLLGLFGVAYFESRSRRVHKAADVRAELGIETLGLLPFASRSAARFYGQRDSTRTDPPVPTTLDDGHFAEAVDSLRNTLLCDDRLHGHSVVMVTSSSQHEGKTFLSAHLASSLARAGRKTLLLDCDLRKPSAHELLGLADGPGLCEVLRGEVELAQAIQTVPGIDLAVLSVGRMDAQVVRALSNGQFGALLGQLRQQFDSVVLDSAPTLVVSDTLLVGKQVDAVILVVRPQVSRAPLVYSAFEQMRMLKIRVLGAVINGVAPQRGTSYHHTHYGA